MFNFSKRNEAGQSKGNGGGWIGYFGLSAWWLNEFSVSDRELIQEKFKPINLSCENQSCDELTAGTISSTSESALQFLAALSGYFQKPEYFHIAQKIIAQAKTLIKEESNILDVHYFYNDLIAITYRNRTGPCGLQGAIDACKLQISIASRAAAAFQREDGFLPEHKGFEQLSIILESSGQYGDAILICTEAKNGGWCGEWDKRIKRCYSKQSKGKD